MTKSNPVKKIAVSMERVSGISVALRELAALEEVKGNVEYAAELNEHVEQLRWAWAYGEKD